MALRNPGKGDTGPTLRIYGVPDATLVTKIASMISSGSEIKQQLNVKFGTGANYEAVLNNTDGAEVVATVYDYFPTADSYNLTIDVERYNYAGEGTTFQANRIKTRAYTGTPTLGSPVLVSGDNTVKVDSGGDGRVIGIDTSNTTLDYVI